MKNILVPYDFSTQATHALKFALAMPGKHSTVHLLNVIELGAMHDPLLMPALSFEDEMFREMKKRSIQRLDKLKAKHGHHGVILKTTAVLGRVFPVIDDYIKRRRIDLVIMGTKGASGMREIFVGSNAERLVRRSPVPVIALKKFIKPQSIRNIVFPVAPDDEKIGVVAGNVAQLQHVFKAKIHVVYVNTPTTFKSDTDTLPRLEEIARKARFRNYSINIFNDRYENSGIINFARQKRADLVAMGTHGRKGLAHAFAGSIAEDVVNHIECVTWTYVTGNGS